MTATTATAAATAAEEFLAGVQAPIPSHPGIKYPVRAPPLTPMTKAPSNPDSRAKRPDPARNIHLDIELVAWMQPLLRSWVA